MQLVKGHLELLAHRQDDLGEHGPPVGIEQAVQRPSDPVIAEVAHLLG